MPPSFAANYFSQYTNTPARRHTFFCWSTQQYFVDTTVYWLLVQQFQSDPKKSQAQLIKNWFLDGNIPENLQKGGFLSRVNIQDKSLTISDYTYTKYFRATTFTSGGLIGALQMKISGATKPPASLFDDTLDNLNDAAQDIKKFKMKGYNPDGTYQVQGGIQTQIPIFSTQLTLAGFDPERAGIY